MNKLKEKFVVTENEKEIKLAVIRPNHKVIQQGQYVYSRCFKEALEAGAIVKARLESVARQQKLWDDEKQAHLEAIDKRLDDYERKLLGGKIKLKEAKNIALEMRTERIKRIRLLSERSSLDGNTAEAIADNQRFNYFASICIVDDDTNKPYFADLDDFLAKIDGDVASKGSELLFGMINGVEKDFLKAFPENKFLLKYKFCNDELHLVDEKGNLVDDKGRLLNKNGQFVDKDGKLVDGKGNLVDEKGNFVVDFEPFTDDEGKPIPVPDDGKSAVAV